MSSMPFEKLGLFIRKHTDEKLPEIIYLTALCALLVFYNASLSVFYKSTSVEGMLHVFSIVRKGLILILLIDSTLIWGKHTWYELIICAVAGILLLISYRTTLDNNLILCLIMIYVSRGMDHRKTARVYLYTYIFITIAIFTLYYFGLLRTVIMLRDNGTYKYSLGFDHPNTIGRVLFVIQTTFLIAYPERKHRTVFYLMTVLFILFSYLIPNCRAAIVCMSLVAVLSALTDTSELKSGFLTGLSYLTPVLCAVFSIVCAYLYDESSNIMSVINRLSTGRIMQARIILDKAGWGGLWGQSVAWTGCLMDNCYYELYLSFGLVATVLFIWAYYVAIKRSVSSGCRMVLTGLIAFAVFGIFEMHTYYVLFNMPLLGASLDLSARTENSTVIDSR